MLHCPSHAAAPIKTQQAARARDHPSLAPAPCPRAQIGGSDQWGNITAGTDLVRRLLGREDEADVAAPASTSTSCFGLTFPLLVGGCAGCSHACGCGRHFYMGGVG